MAAPRRNHEELRTPQSLAATVAQAVTTAGSKGVHNESSLSLRTDEAGGVAERGSNKNSQSHPGRASGQQDPHGVLRATDMAQQAPETSVEEAPRPVYGDLYGRVNFQQDGLNTQAHVADDGRVNINISQPSRRLSELLMPALKSQADQKPAERTPAHPSAYLPLPLKPFSGDTPPPSLNVVIHVVGSRGDVQPFVAIGKTLKEAYGHRVRLATHLTFKAFVEENCLEFFNIGGDPAELMAFMVKNPGLMPGMDSLRAGDIGKKRKSMYEIMQGCWRSCIEMGDGTGISTITGSLDSRDSLDSAIGMENDAAHKPFVADVIIANPPSFAHMHIAEKMGIPVHFMFTMPWSPTQAFPHPLANVQESNADQSVTNFVSYALVEMMTWQGLGDVINRFREKSLGLEPVSLMWAPGMATRLRIPYTYCWSPALIPKPKDWASHISISGFYFLSLASNYRPDAELEAFLQAGPPPVYIGFGSIVLDDPNAMTTLIFDAVKRSGQRALVSKGWGGFGGDDLRVPEGIFMLGNCPHDWLFKHVSCVVHHGGAGTTAAGIAMGKPTIIVPFFGDQPFWGSMVWRAGAGPRPIPNKQLTSENLAIAIDEALKTPVLERAQAMAAKIALEQGTESGARSFHSHLDVESLRCALAPSRAACWRVKRTKVRLSAFAATVLGNEGLLDLGDLKLYRPREYDTEDGPWDPITGGASALLGTISSLAMGIADLPVEILKGLRMKANDSPAPSTIGQSIPRESTLPSREDSLPKTLGKSLSRDERSLSPASSATSLSLKETKTSDSETGIETSTRTDLQRPTSEAAIQEITNDHRSDHRSFLGSAIRRRSSSRNSHQQSIKGDNQDRNSIHRSVSDQAHQISLDTVVGAGRSASRIASTGLRTPMDFTLSLARGFHNAPKLYGDDKVRQTEKVTDLQSGLKVAGKEFGFGLYDGISGLVTQPIDGAKKGGIAGFLKGVGKGIAGVVIKPQGAFWALQGYTFKGIYKEIQKHFGASTLNYIIAARTSQGYEAMNASTRYEREDIINRWRIVKTEMAKQKQLLSHGIHIDPERCIFRKMVQERNMQAAERKLHRKHKKTDNITSAPTSPDARTSSRYSQNMLSRFSTDSIASSYEEAIQRSVTETSKGDAEQDRAIERAIRMSVHALRKASDDGAHDEALDRAIEASVFEAGRANGGAYDEELKEALLRSLQDNSASQAQQIGSRTFDSEDSGIDTDDEAGLNVPRMGTSSTTAVQDSEGN